MSNRVKHVETKQELEAAYLVRKQVFVNEQGVPVELEIDEHEQDSEHFVAYDGDQNPIGAGRLRPLNESEGKVERIAVINRARGTGVGFAIMMKIEALARKKGLKTLLLHAQDHAEAFYSRLGYETISEPFEEAGIMHVKMKKEL